MLLNRGSSIPVCHLSGVLSSVCRSSKRKSRSRAPLCSHRDSEEVYCTRLKPRKWHFFFFCSVRDRVWVSDQIRNPSLGYMSDCRLLPQPSAVKQRWDRNIENHTEFQNARQELESGRREMMARAQHQETLTTGRQKRKRPQRVIVTVWGQSEQGRINPFLVRNDEF